MFNANFLIIKTLVKITSLQREILKIVMSIVMSIGSMGHTLIYIYIYIIWHEHPKSGKALDVF